MRRVTAIGLAALLLQVSPGAAQSQSDPLQGRWEGKVKSPQGEIAAKATFRKEGAGYAGTLSAPVGDVELPFKEITVDGSRVNTKVEFPMQQGTTIADIRFNLKGESLKGKGEVKVGDQTFSFDYDLKRVSQEAPAGDQVAATLEPARPQIGQAGSPAELDEFNKMRAEPDPAAKTNLINEFLKKYPESGLVPIVHREASVHGMQTDNFEMMADHGEKALAALPDDFALMTELGRAYGERGMMDKAEERAENAIEKMGTAQKPPQASEEQWEQAKKALLSTNFSTLGYVHVRRAQGLQDPEKKKAEAERALVPFKKAIELNPKDDISYWRIGYAYMFLNDYPNAESSLARSVVLNGIASAYARKDLEDIYKKKNNSLDGLDKVLAKAKGDLGLP